MTLLLSKQAAAELLSRRAPGVKAPRLDAAYRPQNIEDALQVQSSMVELHQHPVGGWKCLLPIAEDQLVVAPIFANTIQRGETCELYADNGVARIEPEIAFVLEKSLPAKAEGYTEQEIDAAIGSCHMALELMQSRFANDSGVEYFEKLADGLVNQGMFIGPEMTLETAAALAKVAVTVSQGETVQTFDGSHPNLAPQNPVYWLINFMTKRGVTFKAGEAIITGSFCGIVEVEFNKPTTIEYANVGQYQVLFTAK